MQHEQIRKAVQAISSYDFGGSTAALFEVDRLINEAHGNEQALSWIEHDLADILGADASVAAKQEACRRLWRIGTDNTVEALRPMLNSDDPRLVEAACYAIGGRSSRKADDLLAAALRSAPAACRAALEHLIEDRR